MRLPIRSPAKRVAGVEAAVERAACERVLLDALPAAYRQQAALVLEESSGDAMITAAGKAIASCPPVFVEVVHRRVSGLKVVCNTLPASSKYAFWRRTVAYLIGGAAAEAGLEQDPMAGVVTVDNGDDQSGRNAERGLT